MVDKRLIITDEDLVKGQLVTIARRQRYHTGDTLLVRPSQVLQGYLEIINIDTGRYVNLTAEGLNQYLGAKAEDGYTIQIEPPVDEGG